MSSMLRVFAAVAGVLVLTTITVSGQSQFKMTTPIPPEITTPDSVDTRIGTLRFFDGVPTKETAEKVTVVDMKSDWRQIFP